MMQSMGLPRVGYDLVTEQQEQCWLQAFPEDQGSISRDQNVILPEGKDNVSAF